jgi:hypothetical protein
MQTKNFDNKIDVEELIKEFKVLNINSFTSYLKEIWRVIIKS